jgi:hypothetical protein
LKGGIPAEKGVRPFASHPAAPADFCGGSRRLSKEEVEKSVGALAEGGIQEAGGVPAALHVDALGVAEGPEALDPVVLAHPARADAAEGKVVLPDVHDGAVDGDVAGGRAVEYLAPVRVIFAEVVERERSWACVDVVDGIVDVAVGEKIGRMGPKISSWAIRISSVTPSTTVGARVCGRRAASPGR